MTIRVPHSAFVLLAGLLLLSVNAVAFADWRAVISPFDAGRLARLEAARTLALHEAETRGGHGDLHAVMAVARAVPHAVPADVLDGSWRCRQIKLGGMTGYYVFDWFPCRIARAGGGFTFEKDGTQRMRGALYPDGGRWIYLGAQSARGEPWHRYSGNAPSMGPHENLDDQVGALVGIGDDRLRLDLPEPATKESDFDMIELRR